MMDDKAFENISVHGMNEAQTDGFQSSLKNALADERRSRVERLLRGEKKPIDLERLFADLRFARPGRKTVRDIGDFAAHRSERGKGVTLAQAKEIQISAGAWVRGYLGEVPTDEEFKQVGEANLRIATDEQLRRVLSMSRQSARTHFNKGIKKFIEDKPRRKTEQKVLTELCTRFFFWFAFDEEMLFNDFIATLKDELALYADEETAFGKCRELVTKHALTTMHGAKLLLPDGSFSLLRLKVRNKTNDLWIKASIKVDDTRKPIFVDICLFNTSLKEKDVCERGLCLNEEHYPGALEINEGGKIAKLA